MSSDVAEFLLDRILEDEAEQQALGSTLGGQIGILTCETRRLKVLAGRDFPLRWIGRGLLRKWAADYSDHPDYPFASTSGGSGRTKP